MTDVVTGVSGPVQEATISAVERAVERGEKGISVAVYYDSELVADAHAGIADEETGRAVDGDTLFWVASVSKSMVALAVHIQAERGLVDYDAPIAKYWPEFGVHGKDRATVMDGLSHRAGVPLFPGDATRELITDYDWVASQIAAMHPVYEPGTRNAYHAHTFGWVVGEVVRRTDPKGRSLRDFVHEELLAPLGADQFWMGIPPEVEHRVAGYVIEDVVPGTGASPGYGTDVLIAMPPQVSPGTGTFMDSRVRQSIQPSAGMIGNARSVARVYAMLANGGELDGVRLLSPERVALFAAPRPPGWDLVLGDRVRASIGGFWLPLPSDGVTAPMGSALGVFGHTGSAGVIAWCDPRNRLAVAILTRYMSNRVEPASNPVVDVGNAIRASLGLSE